jgi:hypothetical protein
LALASAPQSPRQAISEASHAAAQSAPGGGAATPPPSARSKLSSTFGISLRRSGVPLSGSSSRTFGGGLNASVGVGAVIVDTRGVIPGAAIISASSVGMLGACESAT